MTCSMRSGAAVRKLPRARQAGVVDQQVDRRMALEHAPRGRLDRCAIADVTRLVLVGPRRSA